MACFRHSILFPVLSPFPYFEIKKYLCLDVLDGSFSYFLTFILLFLYILSQSQAELRNGPIGNIK